MRPQDFYIVSRASKGVRVDLVDPAGNREWMRVRSVAAAEFKQAGEQAIKQALIDARQEAPQNTKQRRREIRAELAASLIADWSLPMRTDAEKVALLIQNPRLRRQIERIAENHSLHFGVSQ